MNYERMMIAHIGWIDGWDGWDGSMGTGTGNLSRREEEKCVKRRDYDRNCIREVGMAWNGAQSLK